MSNIIKIRSVFGKVGNIYFISPCPDPRTGRLPSCVKPVNSNGDMILSESEKEEAAKGLKHFIPADEHIEVVDGFTLDLDDVVDSAIWESIKHCNWIADGRQARNANGDLVIDGNKKRYGSAELYVERPGEMSAMKMSRKQLVHRASSYIYEEAEQERLKKCRVLGRNLDKAVPSDVLDYLIDKAEKDPLAIIRLYEDEGWKLHLFVLDAEERYIINKSEGFYKYGEKVLGANIDAVVAMLKNPAYRKLAAEIKEQTYPELMPKDKAPKETDLLAGTPLEGSKKK